VDGVQVGFIAIGRSGDVGAFALMPGFTYAVTDSAGTSRVLHAPSLRR
jgi:N4-(beta-N-acetylglucosaminyl)-L-asparaginase